MTYIVIESTFNWLFQSKFEARFKLVLRNRLKCVRIISKSLNSIARDQIYTKNFQNRSKKSKFIAFLIYMNIFDLLINFLIFKSIIFYLNLIKRSKLHRKRSTLIGNRSNSYRNRDRRLNQLLESMIRLWTSWNPNLPQFNL